VQRLVCLSATVAVIATLTACGSSHHATYAGRLYSVAQVKRAFAQVGLQLHRESTPSPGVVELVNNRRLGPQLIPSAGRVVTVIVATRRDAVGSAVSLPGRVTSYANVTASSRQVADETRAAISALRWGTFQQVKPTAHLILLGASIGPIRVGEPRTAVERAFGPGRTLQRGLVSYFGGRLIVNYWFHDGLYSWVTYAKALGAGYHTTSGAHVGSRVGVLRALYASCSPTDCWLQSGPMPDAAGTHFTLRHGRVASIEVGNYG
jgi:hypothetical protein